MLSTFWVSGSVVGVVCWTFFYHFHSTKLCLGKIVGVCQSYLATMCNGNSVGYFWFTEWYEESFFTDRSWFLGIFLLCSSRCSFERNVFAFYSGNFEVFLIATKFPFWSLAIKEFQLWNFIVDSNFAVFMKNHICFPLVRSLRLQAGGVASGFFHTITISLWRKCSVFVFPRYPKGDLIGNV